MTAILGGGISGLSAAYYLLKNAPQKITVLESASTLGGWIRSMNDPQNGFTFEKGPRTVRPKGKLGLNTLRLVEELELTEKVMFIPKSHPAAQNRLIYVDKKLHPLPSSISALFKTIPPFTKPLYMSAFTDLSAPKSNANDESIYDFVSRRFGAEIADYIISSIICGICAGDSKEISVKFLMAEQFEWEKKHGSVLRGLVENSLFSKTEHENIEQSLLGKRSIDENWSVWSLKGGLQQLPDKLHKVVEEKGADFKLNSTCSKLTINDNKQVICTVNDEKGASMNEVYDHVVCSLPAAKLARLVVEQHPLLSQELSEIKNVTVAVVNIAYRGNHLKHNAFGFLAPPREKLPILGVIFDSCNFEYKEWTVLTVMMGGKWFNEYFGPSTNEEMLLKTALKEVSSILGIQHDPDHTHVSILRDCIPQYTIGHRDRVSKIMSYISEHELPLTLIGSSYYGVGINDVIYTAKNAVSQLKKS